MVCMTATRTAALAWLFVATACEPAAPVGGPAVAEPTQALRSAALRGEVPQQAKIADYVIDARLDAELHQVSGTVRISCRNTSRRTRHSGHAGRS